MAFQTKETHSKTLGEFLEERGFNVNERDEEPIAIVAEASKDSFEVQYFDSDRTIRIPLDMIGDWSSNLAMETIAQVFNNPTLAEKHPTKKYRFWLIPCTTEGLCEFCSELCTVIRKRILVHRVSWGGFLAIFGFNGNLLSTECAVFNLVQKNTFCSVED